MKTDSTILPHLASFCVAAEMCNFTVAAKMLGVSQAAISQQIHVLEKTLGTSLFDRRGGRLLLTDAGRQLYDHAQRILELHRETRRLITGATSTVHAELHIAASSIPGEYLLPAFLSVFGTKYPHIHVRADVGDSTTVTKQVERGEVSIGLVGRKIDRPHLRYRHLAQDKMVLVTSSKHALSRKSTITVKQLAAYPIIVREAGSGLRHCFEKSLERAGRSVQELRITLELGSNEAIKEAVLRGGGVAVLSELAVQKELASGLLHTFRVRGIRCDREMFVVQDRRRVVPFASRLFLAFLETHPVGEFVR